LLVLRLERSTDQVIKPINPAALSRWVGQIPADLVANMSKVAPMLATLGYDPAANPPNYGEMDQFVRANMRLINQQTEAWAKKSQQIEEKRIELKETLTKLGRHFKEVNQKDEHAKEADEWLEKLSANIAE
jgi:hypothetical protein